MYKPEKNFKREQQSLEIKEKLSNILKNHNENDVIVKQAKLLANLFSDLQELENDLDNCFDENREEELLSKGEKLLDFSKEVLDFIKEPKKEN